MSGASVGGDGVLICSGQLEPRGYVRIISVLTCISLIAKCFLAMCISSFKNSIVTYPRANLRIVLFSWLGFQFHI